MTFHSGKEQVFRGMAKNWLDQLAVDMNAATHKHCGSDTFTVTLGDNDSIYRNNISLFHDNPKTELQAELVGELCIQELQDGTISRTIYFPYHDRSIDLAEEHRKDSCKTIFYMMMVELHWALERQAAEAPCEEDNIIKDVTAQSTVTRKPRLKNGKQHIADALREKEEELETLSNLLKKPQTENADTSPTCQAYKKAAQPDMTSEIHISQADRITGPLSEKQSILDALIAKLRARNAAPQNRPT